MAYIITLERVAFTIAFSIKELVTYFLIRRFSRTKEFWTILKPILFYEVAVFGFFVIINPVLSLLFSRVFFVHWFYLIYLLISVVILFLLFTFFMRKFLQLNFLKSLLIFFLVFFIITPVISFSKTTLEARLADNFSWESIIYHKGSETRMRYAILEKRDSLNEYIFRRILFKRGKKFSSN